ncbi:hypothetical protein SBV1_2550002 [Verrucomicrobia bacterium]|nr:hypothetical protein SBV1_2550002 [Verrucomicrobiota bacterium]
MESPVSLSHMHWDHEPRREKGPLTPTLSPSEGAREKRRLRAWQFGRFMGSPVLLSRMHWDHEPGRENGPLSPTLSPSEGAREEDWQRASQLAWFMERG